MGTPILQGRDFDAHDGASSPPIAIVNEAMASYYFGQTDVIGRNFRIDQSDIPQELTIIGVVRNTKYKNIREDALRIVYLPYLQFPKPVGEANIAYARFKMLSTWTNSCGRKHRPRTPGFNFVA